MKRLVIGVLLIILFSGCSSNLCTNEVVKMIESPDHTYVAYLFKRDCGATTKESYQLSILKKGTELGNEEGNVYISYGDFNIEWSKSCELTVEYWSSDVFKNKSAYKNVKINYKYKKS
nr:DUF5412 family protein [Paenibacillus alvei]